MLELDKRTGLRDYSIKYDSDYDSKKQAGVTDPYFGKKIAGGCYVSGEGSYIEKIGNYYYLFLSYGFYSPTSECSVQKNQRDHMWTAVGRVHYTAVGRTISGQPAEDCS